MREWVRICKDEGERRHPSPSFDALHPRRLIHDVLSPLPTEVILYFMARSKHPDIKVYSP